MAVRDVVEVQIASRSFDLEFGFINNLDKQNDKISVQPEADEIDVSEVLFLRKEESNETMTVDTGCPLTLVGEDWLSSYLEENKIRREDLKSTSCNQRFRFGPSKTYTSKEKIKLPVTMKQLNNKEEFVKIDRGRAGIITNYLVSRSA